MLRSSSICCMTARSASLRSSFVPAAGEIMMVIIDYGMGNLRSVQKAIEAIGHRAEITSDPEVVRRAGEGDPARASGRLPTRRPSCGGRGWGRRSARRCARASRAWGFASGLQLLFDVSEEDGEHAGLGSAPRPRGPVRVGAGAEDSPHGLEHAADHAARARSSRGSGPSPRSTSSTPTTPSPPGPRTSPPRPTTPIPFAAVVWRENLMACQFHPEKSQQVGLAMYANFAAL